MRVGVAVPPSSFAPTTFIQENFKTTLFQLSLVLSPPLPNQNIDQLTNNSNLSASLSNLSTNHTPLNMFRTAISRRTFTSAARLAKEEKTLTEQAADMAKKVAGAFKSDGKIGKECTFVLCPSPHHPHLRQSYTKEKKHR